MIWRKNVSEKKYFLSIFTALFSATCCLPLVKDHLIRLCQSATFALKDLQSDDIFVGIFEMGNFFELFRQLCSV